MRYKQDYFAELKDQVKNIQKENRRYDSPGKKAYEKRRRFDSLNKQFHRINDTFYEMRMPWRLEGLTDLAWKAKDVETTKDIEEVRLAYMKLRDCMRKLGYNIAARGEGSENTDSK